MNSKQRQRVTVSSRLQGMSKIALGAGLLSVTAGTLPLLAASQQRSLLSTALQPSPAVVPELLAQATASSIVYFVTDDYVVNIYESGDQILMNVYDSRFDVNRLFQAPAQYTILGGQGAYISTGSFSSAQAEYTVRLEGDREARLIIERGDGEILANEPSIRVDAFRVTEEQIQVPRQDTVLRFDTPTYAVHVFQRDQDKFMNVYNKFSAVTEVNGAAASLAPIEPPYESSASYVSSANRGGQPVEYFARIDGSGATVLEVFNVNGQPIFREAGVGLVEVNIPQADLDKIAAANASVGADLGGLGLSDGIENPYVAAVFGDETTLQAVQGIFPDSFLVDTRRGRFIHTGAFASRDAAASRVFELRSRGFSSRILFRDVDFR